jgi:hypothetical protein
VPRRKKIDELVVVKLLNQARERIDDPLEVNRLLREVGKFYDPLTGRAMIEGSSRAELVGLLERGAKAEALATIGRYIENYQRHIGPDPAPTCSGSPGSTPCAGSASVS